VETEAEGFWGSIVPREYDVVMAVKLPNGGRLNHVLEQMGVADGPPSLPGSEASQAARDKQKAKVSKKPAAKKAKINTDRVAPFKMVLAPSWGAPPPSKVEASLSKVGPLKKMNI
jgi:hypothetical protein